MELNVPSFQTLRISETPLLDKNLICPDKIRTKMFMSTGDVIITGQNWNSQRRASLFLTLYTTYLTLTSPGLKTGFFGQ